MKNPLFLKFSFLGVLIAGLLSACVPPTPPVQNKNESAVRLQEIIQEDFGIIPITVLKRKTLSVYIPVDVPLLKMQPEKETTAVKTSQGVKRQINFVETSFEDGIITIDYDITAVNAYPKSMGYSSGYSDEISRIHNGFLTSVNRALGDLAEDETPDFIVLYLISIQDGVGMKGLFHYTDLKKYLIQAMATDDYYLRYMSEIISHEKFLNNPTGRGLIFEEITWPDFITRQISHRINFKYTRSSFPPSESDMKEILAIVYDTLTAYDFSEAQKIRLNDLADDKKFIFDRDQLETFKGKF